MVFSFSLLILSCFPSHPRSLDHLKSHNILFLYRIPLFHFHTVAASPHRTLSLTRPPISPSALLPYAYFSPLSSFCHSLLTPPKLFILFRLAFLLIQGVKLGRNCNLYIHTTNPLLLNTVSYGLRTQRYVRKSRYSLFHYAPLRYPHIRHTTHNIHRTGTRNRVWPAVWVRFPGRSEPSIRIARLNRI